MLLKRLLDTIKKVIWKDFVKIASNYPFKDVTFVTTRYIRNFCESHTFKKNWNFERCPCSKCRIYLHMLWKQSYFLNVLVFSCSWCKILRKYCQKLSTRYNLQTTMTGWSQKSLKGQTNTYSVFSPFSLEYKKKSLSDTSNIDLIQIL